MVKLIYIDLFCGAGGTSTGIELARVNGEKCAKVIDEIWKDVIGFENHYEVSNLGNIRRKKSKRLRRVDFSIEYPSILLSVEGKHKTYRVHRIVAKAFLPEIEGKTHVNHINGNKQDNRLENLEWVTQSENNLHVYRALGKKSYFIGKTPPNKKVIESDIAEYDRLNKFGISTDKIGEMYGINGSTIRKHLRKYRKL
jgi:site-specific DNA-cytosine methylase